MPGQNRDDLRSHLRRHILRIHGCRSRLDGGITTACTSSRPRSIRACRDAGKARVQAHDRRLNSLRTELLVGDRAAQRNRSASMASAPFFFRQQPPLNAARMHLNPELFLNGLGQLLRSERGIVGSLLGGQTPSPRRSACARLAGPVCAETSRTRRPCWSAVCA